MKGNDQRSENLFRQLAIRRVVNFVAGAVDDYARMIAVAANGIADVRVRPLTKGEMIVVRIFGQCPLIEQLVHDKNTHAVSEIEKIARRIV